jgi:hypothetical protein
MLMRRAKTLIAKLAIIAVLSLGFSGLTATPAAAYGNDAIYQVTFSLNCVNKASPFCVPASEGGFGLGGIWGWFALNGTPGATSGTVDVVEAFCSHTPGEIGAFHFIGDSTWSTISLANPPLPGLGDTSGQYLVVVGFLYPIPADSGHYTVSLDRGVFGQITVQRIPGR